MQRSDACYARARVIGVNAQSDMVDDYFKGRGMNEKRYTESIGSPSWNGATFTHPLAQELWEKYPLKLKNIVLKEIQIGNGFSSILINHNLNIIKVALSREPIGDLTAESNIKIRKMGQRSDFGRYLYDGTSYTVEDLESGCYISFKDTSYVEENY